MKKVLLLVFVALLTLNVKALENVPSNIYYINSDLFAYLKHDIDISNYCLEDECKVYIEYRYKEKTSSLYITLDPIELLKQDMKTIILKNDSEYLIDNNYQLSDIVIKGRYVIEKNNRFEYLDWSEYEEITIIEKPNLPVAKITNLNFDSDQIYKIDNILEIETALKEYLKYYEGEIKYFLQYRVNDSKWVEELDKTNVDFEDVKIEVRVKYSINDLESNWSNTLSYENHPVIEKCLFDSDMCCNKILNISVCIWLLIIFSLLIITLILVDNIKRRKREA